MNASARRLGALMLAAASVPAVQAQTAWLFGEQHDQADHQRQAASAVQSLAGERRLQAVVLEMAERGRSTRAMPRDATEAQVQDALQWNEAWPWVHYRDVVMNAVRAGVPVRGGNLSAERLRDAAGEAHWDRAVPEAARQRLLVAVREGHCGLLPESQLAPMVRMQLARDRSLAETLAEAARGAPAGTVIVMLSGAVHASRDTGVPLQLPAVAPALGVRTIGFAAPGPGDGSGFDEWRPARAEASPDRCDELRQRGLATRPGDAASTPATPASMP